MEHHSAVHPGRPNPDCVNALADAASLSQPRAHAETTPERGLSLLREWNAQAEGEAL